jgi:hypothetical protein
MDMLRAPRGPDTLALIEWCRRRPPRPLVATVVATEGPGLMLVELSDLERRSHAAMEVLAAGVPVVLAVTPCGV